MMRLERMFLFYLLAIVLIVVAPVCKAQQSIPVVPLAKCIIPFTINSTGSGATGKFQPSTTGYDNRQTGCTNWNILYTSTGYTVISLRFESAQTLDNTPPGTPDTYGAFTGSIVLTSPVGINPNTSIISATTTFTGYAPWIRIAANTLTGAGRIVGVLIGTIPINATGGSSSTGGCVGTVATPCVVVGAINNASAAGGAPVIVAGSDANGLVKRLQTDPQGNAIVVGSSVAGAALADRPVNIGTSDGVNIVQPFICTLQASFNLSGSGNTQIIAASGATVIKICSLSLASSASLDLKLTQGTGANCVTGNADVTGLFKGIQGLDFQWGPTQSVRGAASQAICVNQSAANTTGGIVTYAQF